MTADSGISDTGHTSTVHSGTGDPFQASVFHVLRLILQEHQSLWAARLASAGLLECTKPQYALLRSALAYPGLDQAAAGAYTGTDKSTVVALVDRLERRGLLRRAEDPGDRRRRRLFLTDAGEDFVRAAIPVVDQLSHDLLARLSDTERETLVPILLKLAGEAAAPTVPGVLAASRSE
jgi:MarR family transcriptional regulator, temperature-dependent positive regulator of motility